MTTRMADSKGRVTLGANFANRTVIIDEIDATEVRVTLARVIPEREAWLYENPGAKASVLQGLSQAKSRRLATGPNLNADAKLAGALQDEAD